MMTMSISKLVILGSMVIPGLLHAQTSSSTTTSATAAAAGTTSVKVEDVQKSDEKKKDIDDEITDARMRAQLGSKSRWSFKSSLDYSGGSIKEPLHSVRPNYRLSASDEALTSLSGNIGGNVRATDKDNISFGTGIRINDPLHGDITKNAEETRKGKSNDTTARYNISTPYVGWSRGYKAYDTQMISSATYSHYTDPSSVDFYKLLGSLSLSQTILANFGKSKWTGGASISLSGYFTNGATEAQDFKTGKVKRDQLAAGVFPFAQYSFTDRYSFRTVFGYFQFTRYEDYNTNYHNEPYQSVGVGISITRDIYLYPNVQFTPRDIRDDRTNVALSTNINLF